MTTYAMPAFAKTIPESIRLNRQQRHSGLKGGIMQVVDDGPSFWSVTYNVQGNLNDRDYNAYVAWIENLKGGIHQFEAFVRKYPISYPNGNYPNGFNGRGAVESINNSALTVKDVPDGFALMPGDFLTIEGDVDRLHRVVVGGEAVSGEITVTLEPAPHASVSLDDVVHFTDPYFTAQIQPDYDTGSPVLGKRAITFSAVQRLKP